MRMIAAILFTLVLTAASLAQDSELDETIAALVSEQVLSEQAVTRAGVTIDEAARNSLAAAGISAARFSPGETLVLAAEQTGASERVVTIAATYLEETGRRLWVVIRAWYEPSSKVIQIDRVELFWNSPPAPEIQMRFVPHGSVATDRPPADSYATSIGRMNEIFANALDPDAPQHHATDLALVFIDRVAFDADIQFTLAWFEDAEPVRTLTASRMDATGWPIFIIDGTQLEPGFLQVRYRPGNDHDPARSNSEIIAVYSVQGPP